MFGTISQRRRRKKRDLDAREPYVATDPTPLALWFRYIRYIIAAFLLIPLATNLYLAYMDAVDIMNEYRLREEGVKATANVTERDDSLFDVKYSFQPPNDTERYTYSDRLFEDWWAPIHEEDWLASKETGTVEIVYLSDNPGVNRPANPGEDILDELQFSLMFSFVTSAILIGFITFLILSNRR